MLASQKTGAQGWERYDDLFPDPNFFRLFFFFLRKFGLHEEAHKRPSSYSSAISFINENPRLSASCWTSLLESGDTLSASQGFRIMNLFFDSFSKLQIAKNNCGIKTIVFDEGLIRRFGNPVLLKNKSNLHACLRLIPRPTGLIFLEAPADVLAQRVLERPRHALQREKLGSNSVKKNIEESFSVITQIRDFFLKEGVASIIIDAAKSKQEIYQNANEFLKTITRN